MTPKEACAWLYKLALGSREVPLLDSGGIHMRPVEASAWFTEAASALRAVFPSNHAVLVQWRAIFEGPKSHPSEKVPYLKSNFDQAVGVVLAAVAVVSDGHLRGLLDGVRAETVGEVLEQAAALLSHKQVVAAAVLAGGALETHLLHLCNRNGLKWEGDGSIGKYEGAIAKARNDGTVTVYEATDGKQVTAWGGIRNDAAHTPTKFNHSADEVRRMVDGVREFIARTA
jgi:hypothetical protein